MSAADPPGVGPAELIADLAARAAGSAAPAPGAWYGALERLVHSADTDGGLSPEGAAAMRAKLVELAAERLRADALFARHPEVRERPLPVRFVVAGLARSGTTVLHRLLACDPAVEYLPTWQAFHPVPPVEGDDDRRAGTIAWVEELRRARPEAFAVHPLDADAPEEEVFLLQHSFASMLFALTCPLPGYTLWLNSADHTDAYRFLLDLLRGNEWRSGTAPGRPRVMKSPQYVLDLAVVDRCIPDAVIVQTHRDPVDLVGSYCSTYEGSRRRSCAAIDRVALGAERLEQLRTMSQRAMAARDAADARGDGGRFVDVHYDEIVTRPHEVVERLHDAAGLAVPPAMRTAIDAWLDANPQNRAGRHHYDLCDYGLDRATVEHALAPYLERFRPEAEA